MRTLRFYGQSDDLFEIEGSRKGEPDEIGAYGRPRTVKVSHEHGGMYITAHYAVAPTGCWMIGVTPLDEGEPLPDWRMTWSAAGYSTVLEIEVPDDAVVSEPDPEVED